jgi:hypothetical protein
MTWKERRVTTTHQQRSAIKAMYAGDGPAIEAQGLVKVYGEHRA